MKIEPHKDDVVSIDPEICLMSYQTMKVSELPQNFKELFQSTSVEVASDVLSAWVDEGVECEFLRASTGGGWQTGKIRIRFEFIPDVSNPDEPPPRPGDEVS
jgi:hypothetical protein